MEVDIFGAMGDAAALLLQPGMLVYVVLGVCIGTLLAVIPGIGALMGMALLLPFTFVLDAATAIVFLLSALAIMTTADAIPAVLFGVPGTPGSMATVLDGYPMAKKGQAGRALGAAFTSSVVGGLIGAVLLLIVLPVIMPLLMATTSTELLAFCILGLSMVAALAGGSMMKGLAAASVGMVLALIGQDPQTATARWTFDAIYLWDGINILLVVLGVYAIPELADLAIQRSSIAGNSKVTSQMSGGRQGVFDVFRNFGIVLRSSGISAALGTVPAIGPAVIPWLAYSATTLSTRGASSFGKGDVRGVIAVETSNNATVGGSLLPTIALGIPGSAPMALLLGAFLIQGIAPGPDMLSKHLSLTYAMVWTIVLANVIGAGLAFMLAVPLSRIVHLRSSILVPIILTVVFVGAVQASRQWEDLGFLLGLGLLGWLMKRLRWSRSPFVLAFILAPLVERYFFISTTIHGWSWVLKPAPAAILLLTAVLLAGLVARRALRARRSLRRGHRRAFRPRFDGESISAFVVCAFCTAAYFSAAAWPESARAMPQIVAGLGALTAAGTMIANWWRPVAPAELARAEGPQDRSDGVEEEVHYDIVTDFGDMPERTIIQRGLQYAAFALALALLAWLIGVLPAIPLFLVAYMLISGERPTIALGTTALASAFAYLTFERLLVLPWPVPVWNVLSML